MSFHVAALALVVDAALGAWLGVMAFFSFVGAPRAFAIFDERGGEYVEDVFSRYYRVGMALGNVAFVAALALRFLACFGFGVVLVRSAVGVVTFGYPLAGLIPKMEAAGEDGFERYHPETCSLRSPVRATPGLIQIPLGGLLAPHLRSSHRSGRDGI